MSVWPKPKLIQDAHRAIRLVWKTPKGRTAAGVPSKFSHIFYVPEVGAICESCEIVEKAPPTPSAKGLNGKPEPLFGQTSTEYAMFILTWLHEFAKVHRDHKGD